MTRHLTARRAACLVLVSAALLAGCSPDEDPTATAPSTTDSSSPSPTPTWTLRPVVAERSAAVLPLASEPLLGLGGAPDPDDDAIQAAADTVGDWLDRHLDKLQRTGKDLWGQMAAEGLAGRKARRPATTGLASPENPVKSARYVMTVYQDGAPQFITVHVEVVHPDDSVSEQELVFSVADDGQPTLSMFGPPSDAEAAE